MNLLNPVKKVARNGLKFYFRKKTSLNSFNKVLVMGRIKYKATYFDEQIASRHNVNFSTYEELDTAYKFAQQFTGQSRPLWPMHVVLWAAKTAARLKGDFVECGTEKGFAASLILSGLDFHKTGKQMFLFDSWEGVLVDKLTEREKDQYGKNIGKFNQFFTGFFDEVKSKFAPYPFVHLTKGFVPQTLSEPIINEVSFLHIDLNSVYPEVESLKFFWPKLVPGAIVLLDDYAQHGRAEQKRGMDTLAKEINFDILSLPTGQGLIIKPA